METSIGFKHRDSWSSKRLIFNSNEIFEEIDSGEKQVIWTNHPKDLESFESIKIGINGISIENGNIILSFPANVSTITKIVIYKDDAKFSVRNSTAELFSFEDKTMRSYICFRNQLMIGDYLLLKLLKQTDPERLDIFSLSFKRKTNSLPNTISFFSFLKKDAGTHVSSPQLQYFVRSNRPDSDFLKCFLKTWTMKKDGETLSHSSNHNSHSFAINYNTDDRFFNTREFLNFSNGTASLSKRLDKRLELGELCVYYRVFRLKSNYYHSNSPSEWGGMDYLPLVFDGDGKKIPQKDVTFLRDVQGNEFYILLPVEYDTEEDTLINPPIPNRVILQPKSYYGEGLDDDKNISRSENCYKINVSSNSPINIDNISVAVDNHVLDQSFFFVELEKHGQKDQTLPSADDGGTISLSLVKRRKDYMEKNAKELSNVVKTAAQTEGAKEYKATVSVFLKDKTVSSFTVFDRSQQLDYYYYSSDEEDNNVQNIKNNNEWKILNTSNKLLKYYFFDGDGRIVFPKVSGKTTYSLNLDGVSEIIPRFNSRRTILGSINATTIRNYSPGEFIQTVEEQTKLISVYEREDSEEEIEIITGTRFLTERDLKDVSGVNIPGGAVFFYKYGRVKTDRTKKKYPVSYPSGNLNNFTVVKGINFKESLYSDNYILNDPEGVSYISSGKENISREVYLYDFENVSAQLEDDEPAYRFKEGKLEVGSKAHLDPDTFFAVKKAEDLKTRKDLVESKEDPVEFIGFKGLSLELNNNKDSLGQRIYENKKHLSKLIDTFGSDDRSNGVIIFNSYDCTLNKYACAIKFGFSDSGTINMKITKTYSDGTTNENGTTNKITRDEYLSIKLEDDNKEFIYFPGESVYFPDESSTSGFCFTGFNFTILDLNTNETANGGIGFTSIKYLV